MEGKRKKLLILVDTNVGGKGGAETHLWNLLSNLDQSLLSIDVIYFDADDIDQVTNKKNIPGINYYRIPLRKIHSFSSIKYHLQILKLMRNGRYDVVMSFFESSDIITAILGRLSGIRNRISNRRDTGFKNSRKIALVYSHINKYFTEFVAVSNAVKKSLVLQGVNPEKITVIHNAVDLNQFIKNNGSKIRQENSISDNALVFGMVANLNPVKNHASVLHALKKIHKEGYKAHLILAGDGPLRADLEKLTEELGLISFVHFLGAREDIPDILDSLDIFILASHTEGLSNALLEAMASRKPVIASRVGGNVEVIEDRVNGLLVSTDSQSISQAMKELVELPNLRIELAGNAYRSILDQFSIDYMLQNYMTLLGVPDQRTSPNANVGYEHL